MKKVICLLSLIFAFFGLAQQAEAHAIWIETNAKAAKNKAQEVKVFYGEYNHGTVDPVEAWYSDLSKLEVWVISPSQQKTKLTLTEAKDHLKASFTPTEDGIYYITTAHATKDLGGTTKYQFTSVAPVLSGNATATASAAPAEVPLSVVLAPKQYKVKEQVEVQVLKNGKPFAGGEVLVMSPEGWVKTLKSDTNGNITFLPQLKGNYVIEASDYVEEAGEWNQSKYTHSWTGATSRLLVN